MSVGVGTTGNGSRVGSANRTGFKAAGVGQGVAVGNGVGVDQVVGVGQGVEVGGRVLVGSACVGEGRVVGVEVGSGLASALASPVKAMDLLQPVSKPTRLTIAMVDCGFNFWKFADRLVLFGFFMMYPLVC